jgi:hypothetical protein
VNTSHRAEKLLWSNCCSHTYSFLLLKLASTLNSMAEALTFAEDEAKENKKKAETAVKNEQEIRKSRDTERAQASAEFEKQLGELRKSYNEALNAKSKLRDQIDVMESSHKAKISALKRNSRSNQLLAVSGFLVSMCSSVASHYKISQTDIMNNLCSPVLPGQTNFRDKSMILDAPWWAPPGAIKETAFLLCGDRKRTRMEWDWVNSKMTAYSLSGSKATRIWTVRAHEVEISGKANKILLKTKYGKVKRELTAPWLN